MSFHSFLLLLPCAAALGLLPLLLLRPARS
jgi:hypothetical protein